MTRFIIFKQQANTGFPRYLWGNNLDKFQSKMTKTTILGLI